MDLKTLSSAGILLGGIGIFAIAQQQRDLPTFASNSPVTPALLPSLSSGFYQPSVPPAGQIPDAPVVNGLFMKSNSTLTGLALETHLTSGLVFRVTLSGNSMNRAGNIEVVVNGNEVIKSWPVLPTNTNQQVDIDLNLSTIADQGQKSLKARFRIDNDLASPLSSNDVAVKVVTVGTAPTVTGLKLGDVDVDVTKRPTLVNTAETLKLKVNNSSAGPKTKGGRIIAEMNGIRLKTLPLDQAATTGSQEQVLELSSNILSTVANRGVQTIRARWESDDPTNQPVSKLSDSSIDIEIDTVGPQVDHVRLIGAPGAPNTIVVSLHDDDLKSDTVSNNTIKLAGVTKVAGATITPPSIDFTKVSIVGREIRIPVSDLITGQYSLTVVGTKPGTVDPLLDKAGNYAGGSGLSGKDQVFTFSSYPEPDSHTGKHVEFPDFTKRPPRKPGEVFNPGDKVETRVARLYYIRDAHRVAQIINRNVQSYNRAAVKMNERLAEDARNTANDKANERREKERAAIRAAQATREEEHKLSDLRTTLEQTRALFAQRTQEESSADAALRRYEQTKAPQDDATIKSLDLALADANSKITTLEMEISNDKTKSSMLAMEIDTLKKKVADPTTKGEEKPPLQAQIDTKTADKKAIDDNLPSKKSALDDLKSDAITKETQKRQIAANRKAFEDTKTNATAEKAKTQQAVRDLAGKAVAQEQNVAAKRKSEQDAQETTDQAQEAEDRAREDQFRKEVAAASTDPDTYVPGDVTSEDAVTQVSVSVIGEGVLQLRGPIRGINRIRTMINQIDSPLGQVKVGIFTVQVNGEHGDRMEKVATRIEGHVDLSRFLTNQSLGYLRRAIQEVAGGVVANVDAQFPSQHRQTDRDRKYLYAFFGRDFIDELYEMDSEFLRTENKLLSLHGMDTISQSQACFIMALSKNDIRQQILDRFRSLVECEMPQAEWDYRRTSGLLPCKLNSQKEVCRNAFEKYKFRNLHGFFEATIYGSDTMTPMQREFIRLAQIFKSQMVAEVELKQRVIERGMIEDASNDELDRAEALTAVRQRALQKITNAFDGLVAADDVSDRIKQRVVELRKQYGKSRYLADKFQELISELQKTEINVLKAAFKKLKDNPNVKQGDPILNDDITFSYVWAIDDGIKRINELTTLIHPKTLSQLTEVWSRAKHTGKIQGEALKLKTRRSEDAKTLQESINEDLDDARTVFNLVHVFLERLADPRSRRSDVEQSYKDIEDDIAEYQGREPVYLDEIRRLCREAYAAFSEPERQIGRAENIAKRVRRDLDHRKLLELLIDEQEEKYIELVEGTRSHIAQIDTYLKRLAIALEDDFKLQFYDPAFAGVRAASREWDVNLGQVERTTILTNNRQFAKVSPQATMEFDLPKRAPMIVEGMNGARALVQEYGTLLQDPTFLSLSGMMSGTPAVGGAAAGVGGNNSGMRTPAVRKPIPGQSTDTSEELMAQSGGPDRKFGAALEGLIPDPAVYKFETGTGFEIRPVIQPDGHSIIYDFDYMYTTNVREPVRPDEKHLGRVKRHYVHTQVQTASFELREISRYQVALKASRTSRGVPLLEDIPGAGALFRPLPSDESSLQQNIILGQSTVYPTLFDLMGLRWSKYVVDLDHLHLRDLEHVTRGREQAIRDFTFDESSRRVDNFLDIPSKHEEHLRPDLYRQQRMTSPNHPGGYQYQPERPATDPRNRNFTIPDRRPEEYRNPAYDPLRRNPVDDYRQIPPAGGRPEDIDLRLQPPENIPAPYSPRQIEEIPVPPSPAAGPGAQKKTKPQASVIQPANYEQTTVRATPRIDTTGTARATSAPDEPKTTTVTQKKSWLKKMLPTKTK